MTRPIPALVFIVAASVGLFTSWTAFRTAEKAELARFELLADDVVGAINLRLGQHLSLLDATRAFFGANAVTPNRRAFSEFVSGLNTKKAYDGIQGIGFARWLKTGDEWNAEYEVVTNYDMQRDIWPATDQEFRAAITLLEPNDVRNNEAIAYDMFSDPVRRAAMEKARATNSVQATAPVQLVQEITHKKQIGFLVYLPTHRRSLDGTRHEFQGFTFAPFRMQDLFNAALKNSARLPVTIDATDITTGDPLPLFQSDSINETGPAALVSARTMEFAGRTWLLKITASPGFREQGERALALLIGVVTLLLAAALAVSANAQIRATAAARKLQELTVQNMQQKDLMLQEMKHRIKNSIARILAIARQTAKSTDSLPDFNESFSARLQAMSNAQDMLTRSHWQRADLETLLSTELEQVFGERSTNLSIKGPTVDLDERAAQALGLSFHELATNAMKYGAMSHADGALNVHWSIDDTQTLQIEWQETPGIAQQPETKGFGSRLIDASIAGELSGTVDRAFTETAVTVRLSLPENCYSSGDRPTRRVKRRLLGKRSKSTRKAKT